MPREEHVENSQLSTLLLDGVGSSPRAAAAAARHVLGTARVRGAGRRQPKVVRSSTSSPPPTAIVISRRAEDRFARGPLQSSHPSACVLPGASRAPLRTSSAWRSGWETRSRLRMSPWSRRMKTARGAFLGSGRHTQITERMYSIRRRATSSGDHPNRRRQQLKSFQPVAGGQPWPVPRRAEGRAVERFTAPLPSSACSTPPATKQSLAESSRAR